LSLLPKKILIAPLDWGLGHTTRCIPLIGTLLREGHTVVLAADGVPAKMLQAQFPDLQCLPLKGYHIRYSHKAMLFMPKLWLQLPKIISRMVQEHQWLKRIQAYLQFDLIISDNRYGLYHSSCPSVIMTHQVQILTGMGAFADRILRSWHRKMLERFDQCWIVDRAKNGLSGILAHPASLPENASYIGPLSQLMRFPKPEQVPADHCLVLLSGPEPMRGQLEQILWKQCVALSQYKFMFIAGNLTGKMPEDCPDHIQYHPYLGGAALLEALSTARVVICRSGYSTLMDLDWLRKPAILIPTPGQTEQIYLARYWAASGRAIQYPQDNIQLADGLAYMCKEEEPKSLKNSSDTDQNSLEALAHWIRERLFK